MNTVDNKKSKEDLEKQSELLNLLDKKDALVLQLRSGQITMDQYRAAVGNIPTQIRKLQADIEKQNTPPEPELDNEQGPEQETVA